MEYNFRDIETKWQQHWKLSKAYQVSNDSSKPKFYVLDMFPYPSGAGLHVGHPLGYIASDIFARFKRLQGYNVLHPMGYDAFGLPAEQYAIEHGIHPALSTSNNIRNFRKQLDNVGFCYDWDREVRTCDPAYYKWTQWIFLQLFDSWYDRRAGRAARIADLVTRFEQEGNRNHPFPNERFLVNVSPAGAPASLQAGFTAAQWKQMDEKTRQDILMEYRLAYCGYGEVNWCEALGTVLANDEVVNGVSERGGFPVVRKRLRQWYLRITEYADRLLEGLERIEFSEAMKEMQTNWIGRSSGANLRFALADSPHALEVYTTRPDTIFGVDFMVLAPEHDLVEAITTPGQRQAVSEYIAYVKSRSERERMAEKKISGVFTGAYAINPFSDRKIPVWISEYVLAGYGTGAIMAVPCGDQRDFAFATHFQIPVTNIIGAHFNGTEANPTKDARLENSGFLNGMLMKDAMEAAIRAIEEKGIGSRKVNYKMRDAAFSRQRYWGEPFPIKWVDGIARPLAESELPLELPEVENYRPGPEGEGPLANLPEWTGRHLETNTMPGYAGSSWYFLRYMDPHNDSAFCSREASDYWGQVDLYIGGTEHAVGHLLYSRMWTKVLYDLGYIGHDEPYKKLVNQGMIQGSSRFVYRLDGLDPAAGLILVSRKFYDAYLAAGSMTPELAGEIAGQIPGPALTTDGCAAWKISPLHVDVNIVDGYELDREAFRKWKPEFGAARFVLEDGRYLCGAEVEKMSKSKFNTVNPDDLVNKYGADTFRMYEMFLGPVEMSKPWDTKGIEGVHRFLRKFWRLFADEQRGWILTDESPTAAEWKVLHRTIRKITEDTERFSFNTGVSGFMIAVNELTELDCHKKAILEPLVILLAPYAPHIAEELYQRIHPGEGRSVLDASYPRFEEKYVTESSKQYPISVNGKLRTTLDISLDAGQQQVEQLVLANEVVQKWLEGRAPKKIIFVKGKMVNVVV
ncbi:MAG TPA: class I tRNA ligase family protein [Chitinophagaceae bacterium]|nr:class I tRNA ligase family protein [Chitinophagaceae bacterium]